MIYQYSNRLGLFVPGIDPDAKAYIDDIVAAGATVSGAQKKAISEFYVTGKDEGWYDQIKRMYLPIWAVANANAIDLITTNSGTFAGTVTHSAGYITGNGSTGRMAMDTSPDALGIADGDASISCLVYAAAAGSTFRVVIGVTQTSPVKRNFRISRNTIAGATTSAGEIGVSINATSDTTFGGIYVVGETTTTSRFFRVRRTAGVTSLGTNTNSSTGGFPTINANLMAANNNGSMANFSADSIGAAHIGLEFTTTQADQYSAALKTMWETCTGLTLP